MAIKNKTVEDIIKDKYGANAPKVLNLIERLYEEEELRGEEFNKKF